MNIKNEYINNKYEVVNKDTVKLILKNSKQDIVGFTLIDYKNLAKVLQYKWRIGIENYIIGGLDNETRLDRFIMNCPDNMEVDHINNNIVDNREVNLRIVKEKRNSKNKKRNQLRYAKIKYNDVANGEGITLSFWTQGCDILCKGCQNSSIWNFNGGHAYTEETRDEILAKLNETEIERGLAILGGEPLHNKNIDVTIDVIQSVKRHYPNVKIWLWTGYRMEEINMEETKFILHYIDVLIDGQFEEDKKDLNLTWRGSSNQRVIDVQKTLRSNDIILYCE